MAAYAIVKIKKGSLYESFLQDLKDGKYGDKYKASTITDATRFCIDTTQKILKGGVA